MKKKPLNAIKNSITLLCIFSLCLILVGCSGKTEKDRILDTVEKIGDFAEDRDLDGILGFLSVDYSDEEGRTAPDIAELLEKYLEQYRGIAVNMLATKVQSIELPNAEIDTEVSLSSGAAKAFRKLVRFSGRLYRFNLKLVKEDKTWKLKSASWMSMTLEELFPESAKILREIFPNI
jgi:hypothetical protein